MQPTSLFTDNATAFVVFRRTRYVTFLMLGNC